MVITIRSYRAGDFPACRALWVELVERHRALYHDPSIGGDDPGAEFGTYLATTGLAGPWLAVDGTDVVGLTGLLVEDDGDGGKAGEVEPVIVTSARRGQGIGRALVEHALAEARAHDIGFVSIKPVARNAEAMALFHEIGFRSVGHVDMFMDLRDRPRSWRTGIELHGRAYRY